MSRAGTITRRSLLGVVAIAGGGVAFGYYKYHQDPANPLTADTNETVFNPWVVIGKDAVTVITPRAEMGQGVHSTLAALVAEELDLNWEQIRTEHGPPAAAYYNGFYSEVALPLPEYGAETMLHSIASGTMDAVVKLAGLQVTGGSSSMRDAYVRMRQAGAAARGVLLRAAAARLGVDVSVLTTEGGKVMAPDGTTIPYFDLADDAALLQPDDDPTLKDPKDWRLLGKSLPRTDMLDKVTGAAEFGSDIRLPGMVYASVKVNPVLGAEMRSFDASEAKATKGVQQIVNLGDGVAVVASNTWIAMQAAASVQVTSGPAPYPANTAAIMEKIAQAFDGRRNDRLRNDGDVDAALAQATQDGAKVFTAEYQAPYLAHSTMEPMNATALLDDGHLTVWTGNQAPGLMVMALASATGIDSDQITLQTTLMGGGFGRRGEVDAAVQAAKVAMETPGTPVKLSWSREEDMTHDFYRPAAIARMSGVMDEAGPVVFDAHLAVPSLSQQLTKRLLGFRVPGPDRFLTEGCFDQPYHIENHRVSSYIADVDVPVGPWRSVGNSQNAFFNECFLDELAHSKGLDPVEMRLGMLRREHVVSAKVLEAAAQMADWGGPLPDNHARGVAFTYSLGSPVAQIVEISQQEDGIKLEQVWAAIDVGIALDPRNIRAQVSSGIIYGLTAAIMGEISFADGMVQQSNFPDYDALRMYQTPEITVEVLQNNTKMGGAGEPGTPPAAPALANAVFALTGQRIRRPPLFNEVDFL